MLHSFPYLGKDNSRPARIALSEHVILRPTELYRKTGRNVTADNFFTSVNLAKTLRQEGISIIGTVNRIRKEIPQEINNSTKFGVDVLDQMARKYTVNAATSRWPVQFFCNILDLAAINAHILYKLVTG